MSMLVEEQKSIKSYSNKKELSVDQAQIVPKVFKTNPNNSNNNIDNQLNSNVNKHKTLLEEGIKNKNTSRKRMENLNINYTEGKNGKERTLFKNDNTNKTSTLTPKNISKFPKLSKNLNFERIDKTLSNNKRNNLDSERSKKGRNGSVKTANKNETKDGKKHDQSATNLNKTREEKKNESNIERDNHHGVIKHFYNEINKKFFND